MLGKLNRKNMFKSCWWMLGIIPLKKICRH